MNRRSGVLIAALSLPILVIGMQSFTGKTVSAQALAGGQAPNFEVDPLWPKPLPNHWLLGSVTGVAVDAQDNVWIVHQGGATLNARTEMGAATTPPTAEGCCIPAPPVLKFDPAGNLVASWGSPADGVSWPRLPQGITVDSNNNVWIGGAANGSIEGQQPAAAAAAPRGAALRGRGAAQPQPQDAHLLKFSAAGKLLLQIGSPGKVEGSESRTTLNLPAGAVVDAAANEVYVADGGVVRPASGQPIYGNHRVVVFDANTGVYKRHWGAYGSKPEDTNAGPYDANAAPARQFRGVSCVRIARDGMVYVCDRENDRIQLFQKDGKFVKEGSVSRTTLGDGSAWDIAFSNDAQQRFMYVADGHDKKVFILVRDSMEVVGSLGTGGRQPGQFFGVGSIAVDSKGNLYTGETYEGKRVQKFAYKGLRNR